MASITCETMSVEFMLTISTRYNCGTVYKYLSRCNDVRHELATICQGSNWGIYDECPASASSIHRTAAVRGVCEERVEGDS